MELETQKRDPSLQNVQRHFHPPEQWILSLFNKKCPPRELIHTHGFYTWFMKDSRCRGDQQGSKLNFNKENKTHRCVMTQMTRSPSVQICHLI